MYARNSDSCYCRNGVKDGEAYSLTSVQITLNNLWFIALWVMALYFIKALSAALLKYLGFLNCVHIACLSMLFVFS